jgi:hypothetical protein
LLATQYFISMVSSTDKVGVWCIGDQRLAISCAATQTRSRILEGIGHTLCWTFIGVDGKRIGIDGYIVLYDKGFVARYFVLVDDVGLRVVVAHYEGDLAGFNTDTGIYLVGKTFGAAEVGSRV